MDEIKHKYIMKDVIKEIREYYRIKEMNIIHSKNYITPSMYESMKKYGLIDE